MKKYITIVIFILFQATIGMEFNNFPLEIHQEIAHSLSLQVITRLSFVNKKIHAMRDTLYASSNDVYHKAKLITKNKDRFIQFIQKAESCYPQFTKQLKRMYAQFYFRIVYQDNINIFLQLGFAIYKPHNNLYQFYMPNNTGNLCLELEFYTAKNYDDFATYKKENNCNRTIFSLPYSNNTLDYLAPNTLYTMPSLNKLLECAIEENDIDSVKKILHMGADRSSIEICDIEECTNIEIIKLIITDNMFLQKNFIRKGYCCFLYNFFNKADSAIKDLLIQELFTKNDLITIKMLDYAADRLRRTVIKKYENLKCIQTILQACPAIDTTNPTYIRIVNNAIHDGNKELMDLFFAYGVDFLQYKEGLRGGCLLAAACTFGSLYALEHIFKNTDSDVNYITQEGNLLLFYAIREYKLSVVQFLINHGANVNLQNYTGTTPLLYACKTSNREIIEYLLEQGADPNIQDNNGNSALSYLVSNDKHPSVIPTLLNSGGNIDIVPNISTAKKFYINFFSKVHNLSKKIHTTYTKLNKDILIFSIIKLIYLYWAFFKASSLIRTTD